MPSMPIGDEEFPLEPETEGFADMKILSFIAVVAMLIATLAGSAIARGEKVRAPALPTMSIITHQVSCPSTEKESEKSAQTITELVFTLEGPQSFKLLPSDNVLTDYDLSSKSLEIIGAADGYYLKAEQAGDYKVEQSLGQRQRLWFHGDLACAKPSSKNRCSSVR
jgi:hypothetical protein